VTLNPSTYILYAQRVYYVRIYALKQEGGGGGGKMFYKNFGKILGVKEC